jgi:hypothetical protein
VLRFLRTRSGFSHFGYLAHYFLDKLAGYVIQAEVVDAT